MHYKLNRKGGKKIEAITSVGELIEQLENPPKFKKPHNEKVFHDSPLGGHSSFSGGSLADLFKLPDMAAFKKRRQELERANFLDKVKTKFGQKPSRKRTRSEFDGDWEYDRRDDDQPFSTMRQTEASGQILDLVFHAGFSAHVSAANIAKMGNMVAAISDTIESRGIQTNITMVSKTVACSSKDHTLTAYMKVKRAGEYISPASLCKVFSPNFYRRAFFGLIIVACDAHDAEVSWGLGRPDPEMHGIEFRDGSLQLGSNVHNHNQDAMQTEILKALEGTRK